MKILIAAVALIVGIASSSSAQSLGEIAKANAATKAAKPIPTPAKVYTTKDLQPAAAVPVLPVVAPVPGTDEATWKARAKALDVLLANDEAMLVAAQGSVTDAQGFIRRDGTMHVTIAEQLLKARAEVNRMIGVIVNDRRAIADLQDEARRASVPPGWLRWS
jgi:hypothetical protein